MPVVLSTKTKPGFTFSEVLIASTLVGPVLICAFIILETMHGAYSRGERRADLQQSARIGMARIVRELRAAGLDPSGLIPGLPNPGPIQSADTSRIAFIGDANGDGSSRKIEYRLDLSASPPVLRRQQWSTWGGGWSGTNGAQPLAEGITAVEFTYFGARQRDPARRTCGKTWGDPASRHQYHGTRAPRPHPFPTLPPGL
ncbi:MAG: hypothetical protein HW395_1505 [candidate division NC10 bacterium]|nr:hypothetical protein [candidate division NC10 bacterium]